MNLTCSNRAMVAAAVIGAVGLFTGVAAGGVTLQCDVEVPLDYSGNAAQDFVIPDAPGAVLMLSVAGADGGDATAGLGCFKPGGEGATVSASFQVGPESNQLAPGRRIRFIIGQQGEEGFGGQGSGVHSGGGGGGGGSGVLYEVVDGTWVPLIVAGAGGGAEQGSTFGFCSPPDGVLTAFGLDGNTGECGTTHDSDAAGGCDGLAGNAIAGIFIGIAPGAGGGLYSGNGAVRDGKPGLPDGGPGGEPSHDGTGGGVWVCGGGGAGQPAGTSENAGGAGGGYSGGGATGEPVGVAGGGGGSFVAEIAIESSKTIGSPSANNGYASYFIACAASCPGQGDCCEANGSPFCNDAECCADVCSLDPSCCSVQWDQECANLAGEVCTVCVPTSGACCLVGGVCEQAIDEAECLANLGTFQGNGSDCCNITCEFVCPGTGSCCTPNGTPGCDNPDCCALVCTFNPSCCELVWDESCAAAAQFYCSGCEPTPGACCLPFGNCQQTLPQQCAQAGGLFLGETSECSPGICQGSCGLEGSCCVPHATPGCEEVDCCNIVCAADIFCCAGQWDQQCVAQALDLCGPCEIETGACCLPFQVCAETSNSDDCAVLGGVWQGPGADCANTQCAFVCPGFGACCEDNGTPGCEDEECCSAVCAVDDFCCNVDWDQLCANIAIDICEACAAPCPGTGECCVANGTPGCNDADCCSLVCGLDPTCCDAAWDATCAELALDNCNLCFGACCVGLGCGIEQSQAQCLAKGGVFMGAGSTCEQGLCQPKSSCPGVGDCCEPNGTPGCNEISCCEAICDLDPFCCDVEWDANCAAFALDVCAPCESGGACPSGDVNGDGKVDSADLNELLGEFGCGT